MGVHKVSAFHQFIFQKIKEIDNNKKFSSTPPFCFLSCVFFLVFVWPYIATSPENTYPRAKHGEIKVHRSIACVISWLSIFSNFNYWAFASTLVHPRYLVRSVVVILLDFCVVLLCVFTFWVSRCDFRYDFRIKTMFGSSLPPVVCRRAHVVLTLYVFACA